MLFVLRAVIKRGARQMVVCKMVVKPIAITKWSSQAICRKTIS